jgi:Large extracellular alpha-helical protein
MKAIKLLTLALLTLMNLPFNACARDDRGHTLTKLWAEYDKAVNDDRPKDQAEILERIKKEAAQQHLAWDYYDACWKYVDARSSSNWKLRDELRIQANKDIEQNGEPVAVFFNRRGQYGADELLRYVTEKKEQLQNTHNPEFYGRDGDVSGFVFYPALEPKIANDYEYAIWSLLHKGKSEAVRKTARELFAGRYPFDAFIEYHLIRQSGKSENDIQQDIEAYVEAHSGQAVSMLGRDYLLRRRSNLLRYDETQSEEYRRLAQDCQTFINDRKKFSGDERAIADCATEADHILANLTSQELSVNVEKGVATFLTRNIPSVKVRVLDGKREVWDTTVDNPAQRFYVRDTLTLKLPDLDDKTYTLKCTAGKAETESQYRKYTLSIATKRDLDGYGVYVADYITGKPVERCDLFLYNEDGKQVDQLTDLQLDGFTYLPESFTSRLKDHHWGYEIQAVAQLDGRRRATPRHDFNYESREVVSDRNPGTKHGMIITDRSAFNPDETVHYKVLLYEGTYEFATRPAGIKLHATLTDPSGKQIGEEDLTTNEFGTAAGAFVLKRGERGGMYRISVSEGNRTVASTEVRADEFVLPTFELTWKPDNRIYLPLDNVLVEGNIRSYSGHNLGTATATYTVTERQNTLEEGELKLAASGNFSIRFKAPDSDYYSRSVVVTVRVTDATGETLEFQKSLDVSTHMPVQATVMNRVSGRFESTGRYYGGSIIGENTAQVRFHLGYGSSTLTHPNLKLSYTITREGKEILSGTAPNGEVTPLDLSGYPSGLFEIKVTATAVSDSGKTFTDENTYEVVKAADSDKALDMDVRCFFKEIKDDNGIALQVGTTTGPAWVVVELYGDGNRLLEKRIVPLRGERGREGSLQVIRFERKADYPENLTLMVFWFRDERSYSYSVSSYKAKRALALPLSFTRFLDTTAPHHDYSFTIRTAEGTEVAATIFDKSTETIRRNVWSSVTPELRHLPGVDYRHTVGEDESYAFDNELTFGAGRGRVLAKAAGAPADGMILEEAMAMNAAVEEAPMMMDEVMQEEAEPEVSVRENFANTIAWEPFLRSDKDGVVTFNFTTADKLSTYYVQLFAHDKAFHNATLRQEMVVTLPVKVAVVQPQYLYEGDRYVARVTVSNSKGMPVPGRISVKFLNGKDYKTAPTVSEKSSHVSVPAYGTVDFSCEISAPKLQNLGMLVSFNADNADFGSDAVFVAMPVTPAVQTITEAHSALLLAGMDRDAILAGLRSQFVNVSGAETALREISILGMLQEAIPEKSLPSSENLLDQSESLFANFLIDRLPGSKGSAATPEQRADMVKKILACRGDDGGFGWFAGMTSSPILTATLLERFSDMGGDCPEQLAETIPAAVRFLDRTFLDDRARPFWCGGLSLEQYLHVRALYPEVSFAPKGVGLKVLREFRKEAKAYLVPGKVRGLNGRVFAKARRMKTLRALVTREAGASLARAWGITFFAKNRLAKSLDKDITSLLQYAEPHRSGGTYYPNAVMPWRGLLESELYAHSLICDLLTDCGHNEVAEGIRLWIMVQKETQQWEDDPAYIQAIGSVLRGTEETLQTKVLALSASTTLPFAQIKASGNGFTLSRSFTRDGQPLHDGDILHVGDKVEATYRIWNEENRSFVRLTATRPAAFRPVDQLSGRYGWRANPISITGWVSFSPQGYRNVLADRTEFWFDSYPEEHTTITETYFVTQEGSFQSPVPVIESLYAPHYRANDDGHPAIVVTEQPGK